jgi:hypothetical protein
MNTLNNKYSNKAVYDNEIRVPLKVIYQTDPIIKKTWTSNSHNISQIFLKLTLNAQTNHFLLSDLTMSNTVNALLGTGTVYPFASTCVPK